MSDTQAPTAPPAPPAGDVAPVAYPYGQDWRAQLAIRRAEASLPLEQRGAPDPKWTGGKELVPGQMGTVNGFVVDYDVLADQVAQRLVSAIERRAVTQEQPTAPAPSSAVTGA